MSHPLTPDLDIARQLVEEQDALIEDADFFDLRLDDPDAVDRWTEVLTLAALGHVINISFVDSTERAYNEDFVDSILSTASGSPFLTGPDRWRVCHQSTVVDVSTTARRVSDPLVTLRDDSAWQLSCAAVTESVSTAPKSSKVRRCGAVVRIQRAVDGEGHSNWSIQTQAIVKDGLSRYVPFKRFENVVDAASATFTGSAERALGHLGLTTEEQALSFVTDVDKIRLLNTADRLLAIAGGDDDDSEISIVRTTPVAPSAGAGLADDDDSESIIVKRRASTPAPVAAAPLSLDDDEIVIRR